MATTRDYFGYLNDKIEIAPANSQEELQAADVISDLMAEHGLEVRLQEFDTPASGKLPYSINMILLGLGVFLSGFQGTPVAIVGLVLAAIALVMLVLKFFGIDFLSEIGPRARSQNVVAVHRAEGPLVTKGSRPIVIIAHYDTPRESFLSSSPIARYVPIVKRLIPVFVVVAGLFTLLQVMFFIPSGVRRVFWLLAILASLPLFALGAEAIYMRFSSCTDGANDNKSGVAAMLGVMARVRPGSDTADGYADRIPVISTPAYVEDFFDDDEEEDYDEDELLDGGDYYDDLEEEAYDDEGLYDEEYDEEEPSPRAAVAAPATVPPVQAKRVVPQIVTERYETVEGTRHGAEVLSSLRILPTNCEVTYVEPKLVSKEVRPQITEAERLGIVGADEAGTPIMPRRPRGARAERSGEEAEAGGSILDTLRGVLDAIAAWFKSIPAKVKGLFGRLRHSDEDAYLEEDEQAEGFEYEDELLEEYDYDEDVTEDELYEDVEEPMAEELGEDADEPAEDAYEDVLADEEFDEDDYDEDDYDEDDYDEDAESEYDEYDYDEDADLEYDEDDAYDVEEEYEYDDETEDAGVLGRVKGFFGGLKDRLAQVRAGRAARRADDEVDELAYDEADEESFDADDELEIPRFEAIDELAAEGAPDAEENVDYEPAEVVEGLMYEVMAEPEQSSAPVFVAEEETEQAMRQVYEAVEAESVSGYEDDSVEVMGETIDDLTFELPSWLQVEPDDEPAYEDEQPYGEPESESLEPADGEAYEEPEQDEGVAEPEADGPDVALELVEEPVYEDEGEDVVEVMGEPIEALDAETVVTQVEEVLPAYDMQLEPLDESPLDEPESTDVHEAYESPGAEATFEDEQPAYEPEVGIAAEPEEALEPTPEAIEEDTVEEASGTEVIDEPEYFEAGVFEETYADDAEQVEMQPTAVQTAAEQQTAEMEPVAIDPASVGLAPGLAFENEEDPTEEELSYRDISGLDADVVGDLDATIAQRPLPTQSPEGVDDPNWGKSDYMPPRRSVARRATLFDVPDPAESEGDPFGTEGSAKAPTVRERLESTSSLRLVDDDDEPTGRGGGSWKGGAAVRSGLRPEDGEPISEETREEMTDAVLSMRDDELVAHDVWFVALGASSLQHAGMKEFLSEYRRELRGAFVINLSCIGAGDLTLLTREGLIDGRRTDRRIERLLTKIADDLHVPLKKAPRAWEDTDATEAMRHTVRAITIAGLDEGGADALSQTPQDVATALDPGQITDVSEIVAELIRRA